MSRIVVVVSAFTTTTTTTTRSTTTRSIVMKKKNEKLSTSTTTSSRKIVTLSSLLSSSSLTTTTTTRLATTTTTTTTPWGGSSRCCCCRSSMIFDVGTAPPDRRRFFFLSQQQQQQQQQTRRRRITTTTTTRGRRMLSCQLNNNIEKKTPSSSSLLSWSWSWSSSPKADDGGSRASSLSSSSSLFMTAASGVVPSSTTAIATAVSSWFVSKLLSLSSSSSFRMVIAIVSALFVACTATIKLILDKPSRTYSNSTEFNNTVAQEYDAWSDDGILEYYWGEHIHLGYYTQNEMKYGYRNKNFIQAKYDFIDEMMKFGNITTTSIIVDHNSNNSTIATTTTTTDTDTTTINVLDVGCGFGGTSRYLAKKLGSKSNVTGITLSPKQVERGTQLAMEQNVANNTKFMVMDALDMKFQNNTFDIVWACESGEHMPDKQLYISEMMRVLKPGGTFVMACWCQRDETVDQPFDQRDKRDLQYLYEEWTHPYFISIRQFAQLIRNTGMMNENSVVTSNWVNETIASWRHSIWVGIIDPRGWIFKLNKYMKCFRDAYCLERMHRAFQRGLMEYGMFTATKKKKIN